MVREANLGGSSGVCLKSEQPAYTQPRTPPLPDRLQREEMRERAIFHQLFFRKMTRDVGVGEELGEVFNCCSPSPGLRCSLTPFSCTCSRTWASCKCRSVRVQPRELTCAVFLGSVQSAKTFLQCLFLNTVHSLSKTPLF